VYLNRRPVAGYSEFSDNPAHYMKTGVLLTIHVAAAKLVTNCLTYKLVFPV